MTSAGMTPLSNALFRDWLKSKNLPIGEALAWKIWDTAWSVAWRNAINAVRREPLPTNPLVFYYGDKERLRIDGDGLTYYGERIEDAGQAHKLLLEHLRWMEEVRKHGQVQPD